MPLKKKSLPRIFNIKCIISSYRRLALKYHPQRNKADVASNTHKFAEISEAYEVLSDPSKKAVYDSFGETALKSGPLYYKFADNALEIFENFYLNYNPFADLADSIFINISLIFAS